MSRPCSLCNELNMRYSDSKRLALEFTYEMLSGSGKTGTCKSCALMLEAIEHFVLGPEEAISRVYVYGLDSTGNTLSMEIYFKEDKPKCTLELFHQLTDSEAPNRPCSAIRAKPRTKGHPLEQPSLAWVRNLLEDSAGHQDAGSSSWTLPKRVLKIEQGDRDILVCLQENETPCVGSYATLSHCWGLHQACITTASSIRKRKESIPWTEIPQTFRDAIQYCLKLDIHYLWIDALCIIQDSQEDWQKESAKMAEIFQRSLLTIAATSSPNSTAGCFTGFHQNGHRDDFVLEKTSGNFAPVVAREAHRHWTVPFTSASQPYWPLLSRGWVFQEILLSPRVIHIGRTELIWESATQTQCQCGASITGLQQHTRLEDVSTTVGYINPLRRQLQARLQQYFSSSLSARIDPTSSTVALEQLVWNSSRAWRNIVENYSALNLTKANDCLPALSGLAHQSARVLGKFNDSSGPTYLAGLWKMTLEGDLLWRVDLLRPSSNALSTYRAPSWSWASVCTNVRYWEDTARELRGQYGGFKLQILGCNVNVSGQNPFGEVYGGRLAVRGPLTKAKVVYVDTSHRPTRGKEEHDPLHYGVQVTGSDRDLLPFYADYILSSNGPENVNDGDGVFLLNVLPELSLVLRPTTQKNEFRRIGILSFPVPRYVSRTSLDITII